MRPMEVTFRQKLFHAAKKIQYVHTEGYESALVSANILWMSPFNRALRGN